jgi:hypothetical protein
MGGGWSIDTKVGEPRARAVRFAAQKKDLAEFLAARLAELGGRGHAQVDRDVAVALTAILRPHRPGRLYDDSGVILVRCAGCEWAAYPCEDVRTALNVWAGHPDFRGYWLRLRTDK